ncbi:unnamed protein product [Toxocara canis]|uniref:NUDE_C domain-containing protein n=1 Tax=Toxocara canis TaxID=6265 RepID=A0A183V7V9_TOXCA|nr:unnamed protein product [Toxocara canis]
MCEICSAQQAGSPAAWACCLRGAKALAREKAVEERLTEEIEDLKTDREMLSTEVSMLRQEVIDFRARVDGLVEENVSLKERERTLNDTLDSVEDRLDISEQKATELAVALEERDEEIDAKMCEINNLREMLEVSEAENASLQAKLRELREDRDRWRADNEKGIKIINKLYKEQKERRARCDEIQSSSLLGRVRQLETDLEERKRTIDAMSESNAQLRGQVENVVAECAKAKKDAEEWAAKYDKKEKMLGDLLKLRHNTSPIGAPLMQLGTTPVPQTPIVYPRMLGWSTMTGQLTTPLRTSPYARGPQLSVPNNEKLVLLISLCLFDSLIWSGF